MLKTITLLVTTITNLYDLNLLYSYSQGGTIIHKRQILACQMSFHLQFIMSFQIKPTTFSCSFDNLDINSYSL